MRILVHLATVGLLAVAPAPASAYFSDDSNGGYVYDTCVSTERMAQLACATYIRGLLEGLVVGSLAGVDEAGTFCLPESGLDPFEARKLLLDFMKRDPGSRFERTGILFLVALEDRFPCMGGGDAYDEEEDRPRRILRDARGGDQSRSNDIRLRMRQVKIDRQLSRRAPIATLPN
jgi:Rap1a immunity proteins